MEKLQSFKLGAIYNKHLIFEIFSYVFDQESAIEYLSKVCKTWKMKVLPENYKIALNILSTSGKPVMIASFSQFLTKQTF